MSFNCLHGYVANSVCVIEDVEEEGEFEAEKHVVFEWEVDGHETVHGQIDSLELVEDHQIDCGDDENGLYYGWVEGEAAERNDWGTD